MKYTRGAWRPMCIGALALILLVGLFGYAPSRALARQFLAVFRVKQFVAIQVNSSPEQLEAVGQQMESLFGSKPEALAEAPIVPAANPEEARDLAGFNVRLPAYLPGGSHLQFSVKGRTVYAFRLREETLRTVLTMANMDPNLIPAGWGEAHLTVELPAMVHITNGTVDILQIYDPKANYPEGIDPQILGQAGLRILGLAPHEAKRIAERIDWLSTMVLPVPANIASFQEIPIAGEQGILLTPRDLSEDQRRMLLWQKDGVVYLVSSNTSVENLVQVAESMF